MSKLDDELVDEEGAGAVDDDDAPLSIDDDLFDAESDDDFAPSGRPSAGERTSRG